MGRHLPWINSLRTHGWGMPCISTSQGSSYTGKPQRGTSRRHARVHRSRDSLVVRHNRPLWNGRGSRLGNSPISCPRLKRSAWSPGGTTQGRRSVGLRVVVNYSTSSCYGVVGWRVGMHSWAWLWHGAAVRLSLNVHPLGPYSLRSHASVGDQWRRGRGCSTARFDLNRRGSTRRIRVDPRMSDHSSSVCT